MTLPKLTFFCELDSNKLASILDRPELVNDLKTMQSQLSLAILDHSEPRAAVVRRLNEAGIPVTAWLLLPREDGYWFNAGNAPAALECYHTFQQWTIAHGLRWAGVGIDIEPDIRLMERAGKSPVSILPDLFRQAVNARKYHAAHTAYTKLARQIREDGYFLETYQLPFISDERAVSSSLLRRATGLVDVPSNQEVWMLYSSYFRPNGAGFVWSYAEEAQAIGLGSTGGGVDSGIGDRRPLTWDELARDLRLAWYWNKPIYIFSLEGCLERGYFDKLKTFEWDQLILFPEASAIRVQQYRDGLRSALWLSHNFTPIVAGIITGLVAVTTIRKLRRRRK